MRILKRNGKYEAVSFDKILRRIYNLAKDNNIGVINGVECDLVSQKVIQQISDGISSKELDILAVDVCAPMAADNPGYGELASRIAISNLHKSTPDTFSKAVKILFEANVVNKKFYETVIKNSKILNEAIVHSRDYLFDTFGFSTLENGYLLKTIKNSVKTVVERPQYMYMRVAVALHPEDLGLAIETYTHLSLKRFTHASPTLFNAGTKNEQLSSCLLLGMEDSVHGIFKCMSDVAQISKHGAGIGLTVSNIRSKDSIIRGTNNLSDGIMPMLKVYNEVSRYINQGMRKGSIACFVEDTKVFTASGVKNIQDVKIGDMVVTHKNRLMPVEQLHKNLLDDRKLYKLKVLGNKDIIVTGNHKFLSFFTKKDKSKKINFGWNSIEELKDMMENKISTRQNCYVTVPESTGIPDDTDCGKIDVADYIDIFNEKIQYIENEEFLTPVTKSYNSSGHKTVTSGNNFKRYWTLDEDFAKFVGVWLGDGYIKHGDNEPQAIGFSIFSKNTVLKEFIISTADKLFGVKCTVQEVKNSNCVNIILGSSCVANIFKILFSSGFNCKIIPSFFFKFPKKMINSLLAGLISTDGHLAKKKHNITLGLSNKKLMEQIYHLCRNNGIVCTYLNEIHPDKSSNIHYMISISKSKDILDKINRHYDDDRMNTVRVVSTENKNYLRIIDIEELARKDEYVYTLGVKTDHSYTVEGLVVENCFYEPWGADIEIFLEMKKNTGDVNLRARDLFYGLWIPDLFMKHVEEDKDWYLMCPDTCPGLVEAYGPEFKELYYSYVEKGMYRKKIKARDLWNSILISQVETGLPYMCYKDAVNTKSNQSNIGTITSSNLCVEIMLKHDENEYAVCNIATISLGACVDNGIFDFELLGNLAKVATVNLNKVIDINYYPTPEAKLANTSHRPIAVGVQGLWDAFIKLRLPFTSPEAKELNKKIFECIQYNCLTASNELAKEHGFYSSFEGSPSSKGIFQHNMWGLSEEHLNYDWKSLRESVKKYGLRNCLVTALPPTASTANILGNTSSFETITSNIFTRTVMAGNFMIVNKYLVNDLIDLELWDTKLKDEIILANGSVQGIKRIPEHLRELYKTTWETSQKETINMSADRAPFIDHSQSLNIFMANPTAAKLSSAHFHGWKRGLKTGSYYIRSLPISTAEKITVSQEALSCSIDNKEACVMCEG